MSQKRFLLKDYLEPIDLECFAIPEKESELVKPQRQCYPFSKEELLKYLVSDEFLSSVPTNILSLQKKQELKDAKKLGPREKSLLKKAMENIPPEKKKIEIDKEKRRRYQVYKLLEYNLSAYTYFDFFSYDAFQLAKNSKYLAQMYEQDLAIPELLLLTCFDTTFKAGQILLQHGFNTKFARNYVKNLEIMFEKAKSELPSEELTFLEKCSKVYKKSFLGKSEFVKDIFRFLKNVTEKIGDIEYTAANIVDNMLDNIEFSKDPEKLGNLRKKRAKKVNVKFSPFDQNIEFSYELHQLFLKSSENCLDRFKTPIITPEILLVTLMEEKHLNVSQILRKQVPDETEWYVLRFKLLKRLYYQEINVRNQVSENQRFFAYLLKTQLSEKNFETLIEKKLLAKAVEIFRDFLIKDLLKHDLFESFDYETYISISIGPERYYSS
jgi:hypothetical protein